MVYVLNSKGQPIMSTKRYGKVRHLLKENKAKVVKAKPFTIQLLYETTNYTQPITLGIDSGYLHVGFSAITNKDELLSGELQLLKGQVERNKERLSYRRTRRNRLRYRKKRFDNRKKAKGWLAPSLQNKLDTHLRLIDNIKKILPITKIVIEVAAFDIQKIKNPDIQGKEYQEGDLLGFNLREYILHRDSHECQNANCTNKDKDKILQLHHIKYRSEGGSNKPSNLITLCTKCHTSANHKKGKFLYDWCEEGKKVKGFKDSTFMSMIRWRLVNSLECEHTYGYLTKNKRIALKLEKTHYNDAFCIANGTNQNRIKPIEMQQIRRNNRSLQKFYDAKYIDIRTNEKVTAKDLFNGRSTRNKNLNSENLHKYRGQKLSKGRITIRRQRYSVQPKDIVLFNNKKYTVQGTITNGKYLKLYGLKKTPKPEDVKILYYKRGLAVI